MNKRAKFISRSDIPKVSNERRYHQDTVFNQSLAEKKRHQQERFDRREMDAIE
jgi:hypothetical protein